MTEYDFDGSIYETKLDAYNAGRIKAYREIDSTITYVMELIEYKREITSCEMQFIIKLRECIEDLKNFD